MTLTSTGINVAKMWQPRLLSADETVTIGSLTFSVDATGPGTYDQKTARLMLGLELTNSGGQPLKSKDNPFTVAITTWDDDHIAGTFSGTLERTNNKAATPDLYKVEGRFDFPRKRR